MANRYFEFNNTTPNGMVFVDPDFLGHRASLRQISQLRNSQYGKYSHVRGIYAQSSNFSFSPNQACKDACQTISLEGKISLEVSFAANVPYSDKEREFDCFLDNIKGNKKRILEGRQLSMAPGELVAALIP